MRRLIAVIFCFVLLCGFSPYNAVVNCYNAGGGATTEYFGETTGGTDWAAFTTSADERYGITAEFACPGSGSKTVVELSAYVKSSGGSANNIRIAIYDTNAIWNESALVCQGTAEVSVDSTDAGWVGHVGSSNIEDSGSSTPCTLTGGVEYKLAITSDGTDAQYYYLTGSSGATRFGSTERTGGFPATIPATSSDSTRIPYIRVGVQ